VILILAYSMLQFHRKFSRESINSDRCNQRDADGDGVLPAADGARGPWQRTLAGNGDLGERIAPVSRTGVAIVRIASISCLNPVQFTGLGSTVGNSGTELRPMSDCSSEMESRC
jgi:hypothetical protein